MSIRWYQSIKYQVVPANEASGGIGASCVCVVFYLHVIILCGSIVRVSRGPALRITLAGNTINLHVLKNRSLVVLYIYVQEWY